MTALWQPGSLPGNDRPTGLTQTTRTEDWRPDLMSGVSVFGFWRLCKEEPASESKTSPCRTSKTSVTVTAPAVCRRIPTKLNQRAAVRSVHGYGCRALAALSLENSNRRLNA
jgi:hypothetical protein